MGGNTGAGLLGVAGVLLAAESSGLLAAGVRAVGPQAPGRRLQEERRARRTLGGRWVGEDQVVEGAGDAGNLGGLPDVEAVPQGVEEGEAGGGDLALCVTVHVDDSTAD